MPRMPLLSTQGPIKDEKILMAKAMRKREMKEATEAAMRAWKSRAVKDLKGASRAEVLAKIVLKAGKKGPKGEGAKAKAKAQAKKQKE